MDGTKRSNLRKGLRVAIVLKEDQPTGKRTIGVVDALLTSSAEHHRGIKVRLTDGRVGRVQEILGPAKPSSPTDDVELVVLLVRSRAGLWYGRKHRDETGNDVHCLGLDQSLYEGQNLLTAVQEMAKCVQTVISPLAALFDVTFPLDRRSAHIHFFVLTGGPLIDRHASEWSWTGWLTREEILEALAGDRLSPESALAVEELQARALL